ncbi:MAG TPA: hypothetical protein VMJ70_04035 [Candidatus Sulfotelmatobacter sp.]|nr:hypothetical protein [Candidatus Sulfotelmatobacter sp.]
MWGLFLAAATTCVPPAHAIVTEVFYDAIGDDTGNEFVELFNPTAATLSLAGARLEAGDGAGPDRWSLRWSGTGEDSIPAGARFVIGGARVSPAPQRLVVLDLQNGPDAVRMVWPDGASEVVGYGALAYPEYSCGAPAADVAAGLSLSRMPDDADLGSNALDFRAAAPSPGRENQPRRDLALLPGSLALDPERPDAGGSARLTGRIVNRGRDWVATSDVAITLDVEPLDGPGGSATTSQEPWASPGLSPGDTLGFALDLAALPAGKQRLWVDLAVVADGNPDDDRDSLRARFGPGPLALTEIQFHPADGEGEWVEVRNQSALPLDPAAFTLADRGSTRGVPSEGLGPLAPDSLAVFAQDRLALLGARPELDPNRVWRVSPWAALNNTDDDAGIADIATLREADDVVSDRVPYRASGVPAGVPIERRDGLWQPSLDPRGSPLQPPRALPPVAGHFALSPARVGPTGSLHLEWSLPWPRARVSVTLYDLNGRRVATLLPEISTAGRGVRDLSLGAAPPGFFWASLQALAESGGERLTETRALRVVAPAP